MIFHRKRSGSPAQMRVLAVIPAPRCFGLQNMTLEVFSRISKQAKCHFLLSKWNDGEFPRRLKELNISYTETWLGMFSKSLDWHNLRMTIECLWRLPSAYLELLRLLIRFRPSVIYLANYHEAILLWPLLLALRSRVVCHMHDPPPATVFQKCSFFIWRRAVGRFICVSNNVRNRLTSLERRRLPHLVIHNGVEINPLTFPRIRDDRFCHQFGWPLDTIIIGMTGQTSSHKGHEDFIAAAALLRARHSNARFILSVKRKAPFFDVIYDSRRTHNLERHMRFVDWLPTPKDFFEAIDIFVLPSRHEEGFGLVVAEAGERGLPTVCTRSGGAVEIVHDGTTGILVERRNPAQIADAITRFIESADFRQAAGRAARRRIEDEFNLDRQSAQLLTALSASAFVHRDPHEMKPALSR